VIGFWITPDGEVVEVDDNFLEHVDYAREKGWLDEWLDKDPQPEDDSEDFDDDPYYEWQERMKEKLFNRGYIRSRAFHGRDSGDVSIQGLHKKITPTIIEKILTAHKKDLSYPITIEGKDNTELLSKGTLSDWLEMYDKRFNPNSTIAVIRRNPPSDELLKDVYIKPHILSAINSRF